MLIRVLEHGAPRPLTRLEEMVLAADVDYRLGIDEACENVRAWLRAEIEKRLREGGEDGDRRGGVQRLRRDDGRQPVARGEARYERRPSTQVPRLQATGAGRGGANRGARLRRATRRLSRRARAHLRGPALRVPFDFVEVPTGVPTVCAFEASPARVTRLPKPNPHSHAA